MLPDTTAIYSQLSSTSGRTGSLTNSPLQGQKKSTRQSYKILHLNSSEGEILLIPMCSAKCPTLRSIKAYPIQPSALRCRDARNLEHHSSLSYCHLFQLGLSEICQILTMKKYNYADILFQNSTGHFINNMKLYLQINLLRNHS